MKWYQIILFTALLTAGCIVLADFIDHHYHLDTLDEHKVENAMKVEPAPVQPDNTTAKILENDSLFKASTENFLLNLRAGNQEGMAFWQGVTIALHYAMFHEWAYDGVPRQVLTNYKKPKAVKK